MGEVESNRERVMRSNKAYRKQRAVKCARDTILKHDDVAFNFASANFFNELCDTLCVSSHSSWKYETSVSAKNVIVLNVNYKFTTNYYFSLIRHCLCNFRIAFLAAVITDGNFIKAFRANFI